jgi:hypothetical protein
MIPHLFGDNAVLGEDGNQQNTLLVSVSAFGGFGFMLFLEMLLHTEVLAAWAD